MKIKTVDALTWHDAVTVLAGSRADERRDAAIGVVARATGADETWIANGEWTGNETVEEIAAEFQAE